MSINPPRKVQGRKEPTSEELQRIKFVANCRFRRICRLALANAHWLMEDEEQYEGVEDVQRRVKQAIRANKKTNLNITDKTLLSKPAADRTDSEKKYLYRILGGLKCFKRYPDAVKMKLTSLLYFRYFGPGRVIVRQRQEAHALYFIVSGEVVVSVELYDDLLKKSQSVDVGLMQPGDLFGEVSLLHNIPRTATCTTSGHCELLGLMKEDFKNVLQASLQKQWDTAKFAMNKFRYFDSLDEVASREGCIVSKMKTYQTDETILGDGVGVPNFVYFVLSGQCQMIESLQIKVTSRFGREYYSLHDAFTPEDKTSLDLDTKYFSAPKKVEPPDSPKNEVNIESSIRGNSRNLSFRIDEEQRMSSAMLQNDSLDRSRDFNSSFLNVLPSKIRLDSTEVKPSSQENIKTYFMQVCQFIPGATFGFGENMRDRRIIALTPVTCMLMPKVWLLQKNTANIWTRVQHYLEKKVPSKKQVFKEFVLARRWQEFRNKVVGEVVANSHSVNFTYENDVPYFIRMNEVVEL